MTTDQKVRGSNPFERADVSRSNTGKLVRYSITQVGSGSHLGRQVSSQINISLSEIYLNVSACFLVLMLIRPQGYPRSAHRERQDQLNDFGRRVNASQAAICAEVKWLPVKVQKVKDQELYTIDQACAQLAISRASLYRLIDEKQIVRIKIGKSARISRQALERFVSARTQEVYDAWN